MMTHTRSSLPGLLAVVLAAGLAGCESPDVSDLRTEGIRQYRNRQYIESTATLRYALSQNPSDAPSAYYMGLNYRAVAARKFSDGDVPGACRELDTAVNYFNLAIKHWPNYQAAVEACTDALELRGKYEQALDKADAVAENNKGRSAEHLIFAGDQYRDIGDFDSALKNYQAAIAAEPNNARAHASLGKLYAMIGDRPKAAEALAKAQELDPANAEVADQIARLGMGPWELERIEGDRPR